MYKYSNCQVFHYAECKVCYRLTIQNVDDENKSRKTYIFGIFFKKIFIFVNIL